MKGGQAPALVEFLLARLGEDEATARAAAATPTGTAWRNEEGTVVSDGPEVVDWVYMPVADHIVRWNPARVLAECEARRRIIRLHPMESEQEEINTGGRRDDPGSARGWEYVMQPTGRTLWGCANCDAFEGNDGSTYTFCNRPASGCETLLCLAAPYSDHPDFDPVWVVSGE